METRKRLAAFSLMEIMIAIVFISIGFFGYVALHSRILHSGQQLEEIEIIRAGTDYFAAIEVARVELGLKTSLTKDTPVEDPHLKGLYYVKTDVAGRDMEWVLAIADAFRPGLDETLELSPSVLAEPYKYQWSKR